MAETSSNGTVEDRFKRVFLITYPRTASNLFLKMLSLDSQTNVVSNEKGGYFFWDAFMTGRISGSTYRPIENWGLEETDRIREAFQKGLGDLESKSKVAKSEGKIMFAKEHAQWFVNPAEVDKYLSGHSGPGIMPFEVKFEVPDLIHEMRTFSSNNLTILPDEYLRTWTPTFLIRHPALAFPSFYRSMLNLEKEGFASAHEFQPMLKLNSTLRWTRLLYDWYSQNTEPSEDLKGSAHYPLLLDAQDIINHPEVMVQYSELIGMDPTKLKFEWNRDAPGKDPGSECEKNHKTPEEVMMETLKDSSGLLKEKAPVALDISSEAEKWREEFGNDLGTQMEGWVRSAIPDFEYLRARRLCFDN
ncbi:hypothetical protein N7541_006901 [Penicillium brevicompactum]|uniref:Uncharacterized protein n=1 Tax=Penicillium brevicompactum TaxID=5074 RepID=A0A9W9R5Z8_PENBR|nr:hypothetical protein N7541_006901 [Penicillium brevicompactum]